MCYFITIVVPVEKRELLEAFNPRHLHLEHVRQISIESQLSGDFATYFLIWGGCSCGLYQREMPHRSDPAHLRKKYQRKGWSKSKIDRAVSQSVQSQTIKADFVGFRPDVASLLEDAANSVGRVGVIVSWMTGLANDEVIPISSQSAVAAALIHAQVPNDNELLWLESER